MKQLHGKDVYGSEEVEGPGDGDDVDNLENSVRFFDIEHLVADTFLVVTACEFETHHLLSVLMEQVSDAV